MNPYNSNKYIPEILVFLVLVLMAAALLIFVHYRDKNGMERYCRNHIEQCQPAVYPGKVVNP